MTGNSIPTCSVVIRAFNEEKHIGRLLTGILQQTVDQVEIILVDSGSTDATVAIASRYPVKIIYIRPEDFSFGYSLNQGIAAATAPLVVFASAHVYPVYPDWLERLLAPFENPNVALTYGKQRGTPDSRFSEHQIFARWFPDEANNRQGHPFCNNANAAIRKELWENHPYDETLSGLEDLAWAKWVRELGLSIAYVPEAEIIHVHDETPRGVYNRYRREAMAFKHIYPQERFGILSFIQLTLSNIIIDAYQAARQRIWWQNFGQIIWFRTMQFWGTYRGYRQAGPLSAQLKQTFYYPAVQKSGEDRHRRKIQPIEYNESGSKEG